MLINPGHSHAPLCLWQLVLMKDKRKVFTLDNLGYEPEAGALHPGGGTAAVGGAVRHPVSLGFVALFRRPWPVPQLNLCQLNARLKHL